MKSNGQYCQVLFASYPFLDCESKIPSSPQKREQGLLPFSSLPLVPSTPKITSPFPKTKTEQNDQQSQNKQTKTHSFHHKKHLKTITGQPTNMGRELPSPPEIHLIHFHAFLIASILATLAILAAICASCHRKPKKAPPLGEKIASLGPTSKADTMTAPTATSIEANKQDPEKQEKEITELEGEIHGPIYPSAELSKSKRRLSMSTSMGLQGRLSRIRTGRRERKKEEEETLWKKTIIMGEKNKVPPWEEEEEEGVEKYAGESCRKNYRPRSLPVSPIKRAAGEEVPSTGEA